ncbi:ATP:Cob(I)alamin adenosyltransferase [Paramagnetospirillum magnetotacticum MS-1]|uniref:Corrinoid adenosyltransferase n=1 Tax=Paramagnetospirillum magnetotacticum MS-1 TaxID=272627 RepID=A0A0C2YJ43_PARME|nr:cob(I)yrinic acid a,c-diamide adenosyltransferase [Paramagnetospirillum magnetotacticum]KIL99789.1 ATP:Cob(I)alamin adenosyltransferase [Paramagnetospirillum magnetotacticum MS-1]
MVTLTRIYTRSGDKGKTSLGDGTRVGKHDLRVEAYGTVDEANAVLGLARLHAGPEMTPLLERVQNDLFDLGADLCTPAAADEAPGTRLRMVQVQVDRLEAEIDAANESLAPLSSFILPAGSPLAAHLHHARTVVRRAERLMVALAETEAVNPLAVIYANRLSDLLFVLARVANGNGAADVLWVPGGAR